MGKRRWWPFSSWDQQAEIARLEQDWCSRHDEEPVGVPDELLAKFKDSPEERAMSDALWAAAAQGRKKNWAVAIPAFRDVHLDNQDWDVPYVWFARFLEDNNRAHSAVTLLRTAAPYCRRQSLLLANAGDIALFGGDVRAAVHLFAQSIAAKAERPTLDETGLQRPYLFLAELLEVFGDRRGARWAAGAQGFTTFDDDYKDRVRGIGTRASESDRRLLTVESPLISKALRKRL